MVGKMPLYLLSSRNSLEGNPGILRPEATWRRCRILLGLHLIAVIKSEEYKVNYRSTSGVVLATADLG